MSKKERIRQLLADGQPHTVEELVRITHRFSAVIHSLREDGEDIKTIPIAHNVCVYQMLTMVKSA
ncbi:hypothetical protein [Nostoc sp. 106C]|uniref:hypothetical protein n=1 Tax=Nostoc sp. 106C TaxID=1932667 RepID=UPI000A3ADD0F|nr:hypothetical protein [Nostoc sp. 106C]OUL21990.1 hypothetical protein BV375_27775 [Nostoc sp. 106C]